jgi:hypothetical protein
MVKGGCFQFLSRQKARPMPEMRCEISLKETVEDFATGLSDLKAHRPRWDSSTRTSTALRSEDEEIRPATAKGGGGTQVALGVHDLNAVPETAKVPRNTANELMLA